MNETETFSSRRITQSCNAISIKKMEERGPPSRRADENAKMERSAAQERGSDSSA